MTLLRIYLLLLAVALLCGLGAWIAYERSIVVQRRTVRAAWEGSQAGHVVTAAEYQKKTPVAGANQRPAASVPWLRRQLGDEAIQHIRLLDPTDDEAERAALLFPEAELERGTLQRQPTSRRMEA